MAQEIEQLEPQLRMRRATLDDLPKIELPEGYSIRTSRDGDAIHWARIIRESFEDANCDESLFERRMVSDQDYLPERIFFVCAPDGMPCGTASAYRSRNAGQDVGALHMVGVRPIHTGMRLGFAVSLAVLHRFRSEGLTSAVLLTDDYRLPAIKTYLRLGFLPLFTHNSHAARWDAVYARLGMKPARGTT
jgi:mycothiol synthase